VTVSITSTWLENQADAQRRSFHRALWASAALHLAFGATLAFSPERAPVNRPEYIAVRLVTLPQSQPKPKPRAVPEGSKPIPAPAAPKPAPVAKKVILPKQAQSVKKKRKAKPKPLDYDDALASLRADYDDALASLRAELGEAAPEPAALEPEVIAEADTPPAPAEVRAGVELPPETLAFMKATKNHLKKYLKAPPDFMNRGLRTELRVLLSISGEVIGNPEVVVSSGDPYWDDNSVRALLRASPLPVPPEAGEWTFGVSPEETR